MAACPELIEACGAEVAAQAEAACQAACAQDEEALAVILSVGDLACEVVVPQAINFFGLSEVCVPEPDPEVCDDGADNDGDEDVDCDDADCTDDPACLPDPEVCDDGSDNDEDGAIDCRDEDCVEAPACQEVCDDGIDNDFNMLIDCDDFACIDDPACAFTPEDCDDGIDNDDDQAVDCDDIDCANDPACLPDPEVCNDGQDNDGDQAVDCDDADCVNDPACAIPTEICNDGQDNDGDQAVDCLDADCDVFCLTLLCDEATAIEGEGTFFGDTSEQEGSFNASQECRGAGNGPEDIFALQVEVETPVCVDTFGSDSDTVLHVRSDCADVGSEEACNDDARGLQSEIEFIATPGQTWFIFVDSFEVGGAYSLAVDFRTCTERVCDDGIDNDEDEGVDCNDADCANDPACLPDPEVCNDGIDNDGDEAVDCLDADCDVFCLTLLCDGATVIEGEGFVFGDTSDRGGSFNAGRGCRGAGNGPEDIYALQVGVETPVCVDTFGSDVDTVLHVRSDCADVGSEEACNDDAGGGLQSEIEFIATPGQTWFIFVDSFEVGGAYSALVRFEPCEVPVFEVCDDQEDNDFDGAIDCEDEDCVADPICVVVGPPTLEGDVIVTEIMYDTEAPLSDGNAEYIEVFNTSDLDFDLTGCVLRDGSTIATTLEGVTIEAGGFALFGGSVNPDINGGLNVDAEFAFGLNNTGDVVSMTCGELTVFRLSFDDGDTFPEGIAASIQLDAGSFSALEYDSAANWCLSEDPYLVGDPDHLGTPGNNNILCPVVIEAFTTQELQARINVDCGGGFCHLNGDFSGGLALDEFEGATILIPSSLQGFNYIEPGSPANSYLFRKLAGTQAEIGDVFGSRMPLFGTDWSDEDLARLAAYIEGLAR